MGVTEVAEVPIALPMSISLRFPGLASYPAYVGHPVHRGPIHVIASEAKQSTWRHNERIDCFALLAMTGG
jgi:hypothetical protein